MTASPPWTLAVDLGAETVLVAVGDADGEEVLANGTGGFGTPAAVYLRNWGNAAADPRRVQESLVVGAGALRRAPGDPSRYLPAPREHVGALDVPLGGVRVATRLVIAAILSRAFAAAARERCGAPSAVVLTHPALWGAIRTDVLREAARDAATEVFGADKVVRLHTVAEPVAAALAVGAGTAEAPLAVLDVGAVSTDLTVLGSDAGGVPVPLAAPCTLEIGGQILDQVIVGLALAQLTESERDALASPRSREQRARAWLLWQNARRTREELSTGARAALVVPGGADDTPRTLQVSRPDFEAQAAPMLTRVAAAVRATLSQVERPCAVVALIGGASRTPALGAVAAAVCSRPPSAVEHPETTVVLGALRSLHVAPTGATRESRPTGSMPDPRR